MSLVTSDSRDDCTAEGYGRTGDGLAAWCVG